MLWLELRCKCTKEALVHNYQTNSVADAALDLEAVLLGCVKKTFWGLTLVWSGLSLVLGQICPKRMITLTKVRPEIRFFLHALALPITGSLPLTGSLDFHDNQQWSSNCRFCGIFNPVKPAFSTQPLFRKVHSTWLVGPWRGVWGPSECRVSTCNFAYYVRHRLPDETESAGLSKFSDTPLVPGLILRRTGRSGGVMNKSHFFWEILSLPLITPKMHFFNQLSFCRTIKLSILMM